jgi:hypothetical protein
VLGLNHPLATDEEAGGDAQHAVSFGHSAAFVQQGGKRQAMFLSESLYSGVLFADIHSQDDETLIAVFFVSLLQSGPLSTAVRSPSGPEIEEHRLASQVAQRHLIAVQIGQYEIRRPGSFDLRGKRIIIARSRLNYSLLTRGLTPGRDYQQPNQNNHR